MRKKDREASGSRNSQGRKFIDAARELGAETDDEGAFDAKLKTVASVPATKPQSDQRAKKPAK